MTCRDEIGYPDAARHALKKDKEKRDEKPPRYFKPDKKTAITLRAASMW